MQRRLRSLIWMSRRAIRIAPCTSDNHLRMLGVVRALAGIVAP